MIIMLESSRSDRDAMGGLDDNPLYFGGDATALSAGMDGTSSLESSAMDASISNTTSHPESSASSTISGGEAGSLLTPRTAFGTIAYAMPTPMDGSGAGGNATTSAGQSSSSYNANATSIGSTAGQTLGPPTRYGAKNESAKLHLLKLLEWEQANEGSGVAALMNLPGMDTGTAESIMDWLDEDDEPRANGAESEFYSTLTRPLIPRNALPPDLDELLFIRGVDTWRLFGLRNDRLLQQDGGPTSPTQPTAQSRFGTDAQTGGGLFSRDSSIQGSNYDADRSPFRPWSEFLTVYSAERNETYTGAPRLFVNGKKLQDLHQQLLEIIPLEIANFLILYRQFGPTTSEADEESETAAQLDANQSADSVTISFETDAKFVIEIRSI